MHDVTCLPEIERYGTSLVYPIPLDASWTVDRFSFYHLRFLKSKLYQDCIVSNNEKAGFYALSLWCNSFDDVPVGTIPSDYSSQAFMVGLGGDLRRWHSVCSASLRGFRPIVDVNYKPIEGRLAHEFVLSVIVDAWNRSGDVGGDFKRVAGPS